MKRMEGQIATAEITVHKRKARSKKVHPRPISEVMKNQFNPAGMSAGYKRGMVLLLYKDKIRRAVGNERFLGDLEYGILSGGNEAEYNHPVLTLHFKSGSIWIAEMQWHTRRIKELINKRLGCEFLREVRLR